MSIYCCPLCTKPCTPVTTHSIPNAYFKAAKRHSSGKALQISDGPEARILGNTPGGAPLLCSSCEKKLNANYDRWGIEKLRAARKKIKQHGNTRAVKIERDRFAGFILSMLWREALLPSTVTDGFTPLPAEVELFRRATLRNNLFHGLKWAYGMRGQRDNFIHASRVLMLATDRSKIRPPRQRTTHFNKSTTPK